MAGNYPYSVRAEWKLLIPFGLWHSPVTRNPKKTDLINVRNQTLDPDRNNTRYKIHLRWQKHFQSNCPIEASREKVFCLLFVPLLLSLSAKGCGNECCACPDPFITVNHPLFSIDRSFFRTDSFQNWKPNFETTNPRLIVVPCIEPRRVEERRYI